VVAPLVTDVLDVWEDLVMSASPRDGAGSAIADFWSWWADARSKVDAALAARQLGALQDEVSAHVAAIHPELEWEIGNGLHADHVLCVTSAGVMEHRALTERWRLAGPAGDATWEYAGARLPDPAALDIVLTHAGTELALAATRLAVNVDEERQLLDIVVHHPRFHEMEDGPKRYVVYLVLDWVLGEDEVERWIRAVDPSDGDPPDSVPIGALGEIVSSLRARHTEPNWALFDATGPDGGPMIIVARRPLKRVEHPLFDLHGEISLPFAARTPMGLPEASALEQLRAFEDVLMAALGNELLLAGHQTHAGVRTFHVYCDGQGTARAEVDAFLARWSWPGASLAWSLDPEWAVIRPYS
jgi:hypothetical protein